MAKDDWNMNTRTYVPQDLMDGGYCECVYRQTLATVTGLTCGDGTRAPRHPAGQGTCREVTQE